MSYLSRLVNTPSSSKQGVVLFLLFAALIVVPSNCVVCILSFLQSYESRHLLPES